MCTCNPEVCETGHTLSKTMAEDDCLLPTYTRPPKTPKETLKMYLLMGLFSFTVSAAVTFLVTQFAGYRTSLLSRGESSEMLPSLKIPPCMISIS